MVGEYPPVYEVVEFIDGHIVTDDGRVWHTRADQTERCSIEGCHMTMTEPPGYTLSKDRL